MFNLMKTISAKITQSRYVNAAQKAGSHNRMKIHGVMASCRGLTYRLNWCSVGNKGTPQLWFWLDCR